MKKKELVFTCFYCGGDVVYGEWCSHCDKPLQWDDILLTFQDKYVEVYEVCVK